MCIHADFIFNYKQSLYGVRWNQIYQFNIHFLYVDFKLETLLNMREPNLIWQKKHFFCSSVVISDDGSLARRKLLHDP